MNNILNVNICQFYQWIGTKPSETSTQVKTFNTTVNIGAVRALFEKLSSLPADQRQQITQWGLYVNDQITIELVAWGIFKLGATYQRSMLTKQLTLAEMRGLLFSPCLVSQQSFIHSKGANQESLRES